MGKIAESLFDLERFLRSNKVNSITLEEANVLMECKWKAVRDFGIGTAVSSIVIWFATRKFSKANRLLVAGGSGCAIGSWWFGRSMDSSVDHILSMEGKRIKDEMAKIVLMKFRNDPSVMQRVTKHFYSENVYDDSSLDQPKLRWRVRTSFSDPVALEKMGTHNQDNEVTSKERTMAAEKIKKVQKQVNIRTAIDSLVDPFDDVFGLPQTMNGNHQPDATSVPQAQGTRSQRRSRRRHRKLHQKVSGEEASLARAH